MTPEPRAEPENLSTVVHRLSGLINKALPPGDVAALRRLDPHRPGTAPFWKLVASVLEPAGVIASGGARRDLDEQRWSLVLKCLALLGPLHRPGQQAGTALAEAGYSELRFTRLLRARADGLLDAVEGVARYLAAKGTPVDASDLLWLMVSEDTDAEESVRRRFARSYYAALSQR